MGIDIQYKPAYNFPDPTTVDGTEVSHHIVQCPVGSPCNITVQAVDYFGRKGPPSEPIVQALQAPPGLWQIPRAKSLCRVKVCQRGVCVVKVFWSVNFVCEVHV